MRASVIAPDAAFSESPESTMPYSFILAMEKAICASVISGLLFLIASLATRWSPYM